MRPLSAARLPAGNGTEGYPPSHSCFVGRAFSRSVQTDVSAVLDDHALRALGDLALFVPGHAVAGQTVKLHGGELLEKSLWHISGMGYLSADLSR